jgi:hypothetical protein
MNIGIVQSSRNFLNATNLNKKPVANNIVLSSTGNTYSVSWDYFDFEGDLEDAPLPISIPSYCGVLAVDQILIGSHTFSQINGASEGNTLHKWYSADDINGTNETLIGLGTGLTLTNSELDKHIKYSVTPVTQGGTSGNTSTTNYSESTVTVSLVERKMYISYGSSTSPLVTGFTDTWNHAYTDNPNETYKLLALKRSDNVTTSIGLVVDLAMTDNTLGVTTNNNSGIFPDAAMRQLWFSTGTRGFTVTGLTDNTQYNARIHAGTTNSGVNHAIMTFDGEQNELADCRNNTSTALEWSAKYPTNGNLTVRIIDGTGLSPINCMELTWLELP